MKFNLPLPTEARITQNLVPGMLVSVIEALVDISKGGLTAKDNLTSVSLTSQLTSGDSVIVQHNLKNVPTVVLLSSGRVEVYAVSKQSNTQFTVTAKLLSTRTVIQRQAFFDRIEVEDAALFNIDDTIVVGEYVRTIKNIQKRVITLNKNLLLGDSVPVTLAKETCSFFLM